MRLFVFLGSLLVLALVAALVMPPFVDWNQFRDRFEREASRIAGQDVQVLGTTSARLLPLPSVTFSDIRVGPTDQPLLTAGQFHINMELAPLLRGEVVIVDIALEKPRFDVRLDSDGLLALPPVNPDLPVDVRARDVALDRFSITDGIVRLRDEGDGREIILRDIDVAGSARTLAGPWKAAGQFVWRDRRFRIDGGSGVYDADGADGSGRNLITLKAKVEPQDLAYDFSLSGSFGLPNGLPQIDGEVSVVPAQVQSDIDRISFDRSKAAAPVDARLEGGLRIGARGAIVPAYRIEVGDSADPYVITGNAFANFTGDTSFEINAEGQQIDLSRLAVQDDTPRTLESRLSLLRDLIAAVPRPNLPGTINLDLPAVVAEGTVIRDVALKARPRSAGWRIDELKAELPGRTGVLAKGDLGVGDAMTYAGELTLASRQPSGLAAWLADDVPNPIRALRNAGFSGDVVFGDGVARADNVEIVLDDKRLVGAIAETGRESGSPRLDIALEGEAIDWDALTAIGGLLRGEDDAERTIGFDLATDALKVRGMEAGAVAARGAWREGQLALEALSIGDLRGAEVETSGSLSLSDTGLRGKLSGTIAAAEANGLVDLARPLLSGIPAIAHLIEEPDLLNDLSAQFEIEAGEVVSTISATGSAGGTSFETEWVAEGQGPWIERPLSANATFASERSETLLSQLGFDPNPLIDPVPAKLSVSVRGKPSDAITVLADGSAADIVGAGQGELALVEGGAIVGTLDVDLRSANLDTLTLVSGIALPGFGQGETGEVRAALTLSPDTVSAEKLSARIGETTLRGALSVATGEGLRPQISGSLQTSPLDLETIAFLAWGAASEDAESLSRPLAGLDGTLDMQIVAIRTGGGFPDIRDVRASLILADGDLLFGNISSLVDGAAVTGALDLNRAGQGEDRGLALSGSLQAKGVALADLARLFDLPMRAEGLGDLDVSLNATAPDRAGLAGNLTGGGTLTMDSLSLNGLNGDAFKALLKAGDAVTAGPVRLDAARLREVGLLNGKTVFEGGRLPFSINNGTVRFDDIALKAENLTASADLRFPVQGEALEGSLDVTFAAGREALPGLAPAVSLSVSGSRSAPKLAINATEIDTFLNQRNAQAKERAFLNEQAAILDRQRLSRTLRALQLEEARAEREREAARQKEERQSRQAEDALPEPIQDLNRRVLERLSPSQ